MKTDYLYSKTDGNGGDASWQIPSTSLSGPDVLVSTNQNRKQFNSPAIKVTPATQHALDYYNKVGNCKTCR